MVGSCAGGRHLDGRGATEYGISRRASGDGIGIETKRFERGREREISVRDLRLIVLSEACSIR